MNSWLILDKPLGLTSTQALGKAKKLFGIKKAGHAGTLDPLASGILPIAFGEATKTIPFVQDATKEYEFTIAFGTATDTEDAEGAVIASSDARPTLDEITAILPRFTGPISQIPPRYAAIKINGERAYDLARAGAEFEMVARQVTIYELELIPSACHPSAGWDPSSLSISICENEKNTMDPSLRWDDKILDKAFEGNSVLQSATLKVSCSKGTYVRSLARDIAEAVGTVGHVSHLRRTRVGKFRLESAISLDNLAAMTYEDRAKAMLPFATALDDIPALAVNDPEALKLRQGQVILGSDPEAPHPPLAKAMSQNQVVGLVEFKDGFWHPVRIFNL